MEELKNLVTEVKTDLEDLISLSNQSQGSNLLNLTIKLEKFEDKVEERLDYLDDKLDEKINKVKEALDKSEWQRWKTFGGAIALAVTIFIGTIFLGANILQDRMSKIEKEVTVVQESDKSQVSFEKFLELQKTSEKDRALILEKLNHVVSTNDFNLFKKEVYDVILKLHLGDKNERPTNSGK